MYQSVPYFVTNPFQSNYLYKTLFLISTDAVKEIKVQKHLLTTTTGKVDHVLRNCDDNLVYQ